MEEKKVNKTWTTFHCHCCYAVLSPHSSDCCCPAGSAAGLGSAALAEGSRTQGRWNNSPLCHGVWGWTSRVGPPEGTSRAGDKHTQVLSGAPVSGGKKVLCGHVLPCSEGHRMLAVYCNCHRPLLLEEDSTVSLGT